MIYNLQSTFFKTDLCFGGDYMGYLDLLLLEGEEVIKTIPPYKSLEVIAWFTNKRIIFTSSPATINALGKTGEVEFLPYKSIQSYMLLNGNTLDSYKVDLFLGGQWDISFFMPTIGEAMDVLKLIGEKCAF